MKAVWIIFALEREAVPFRRLTRDSPEVRILVSGVGGHRARISADVVIREFSPRLLIAAGFCGALIPTLRVGDIVTWPRIVTVDYLVSDPAEKRRLAELHSADAVDMESAAIAEVCTERSIPFAVIRAVSDTSDTALSPDLVKLLSGGNVSIWRACRALVRKPSLLREFLRLRRDTKLAALKLAEALVKVIDSGPAALRSEDSASRLT